MGITLDEVKEKIETPDVYREYAMAHCRGSKAGKIRDACECPIARWLKSLGLRWVMVGHNHLILEIGGVRHDLPVPKWIASFTREVDYPKRNYQAVSFGRTLTILNKVAAQQEAAA